MYQNKSLTYQQLQNISLMFVTQWVVLVVLDAITNVIIIL